jgi:hypothetical protein
LPGINEMNKALYMNVISNSSSAANSIP